MLGLFFITVIFGTCGGQVLIEVLYYTSASFGLCFCPSCCLLFYLCISQVCLYQCLHRCLIVETGDLLHADIGFIPQDSSQLFSLCSPLHSPINRCASMAVETCARKGGSEWKELRACKISSFPADCSILPTKY